MNDAVQFGILPALYSVWLGSAFQTAHSSFINGIEFMFMLGLLMFTMTAHNTSQRAGDVVAAPTRQSVAITSLMVVTSILALGQPSTFLYYQF